MIQTDYPVGAAAVLLDKSCLPERFFPLIPYRDALLSGLPAAGCRTKNDAAALPDDTLIGLGLPDETTVRLFRRFLALYDPDPRKFREIDKVTTDPDERAAFRELYCLPGVKAVRAALYCRSGYRTLADLADTTAEAVIERTARTITEQQLACIVPLPKEVRTHIAVAKSFLWTQEGVRI